MAVPTTTGLEPSSGPEGTLCVITGTDFLEDASAVVFGTYSCGFEYTVISDTQISCIVPAGTGAVTVKVTTSGGTNSTGVTFTYATYEGGSNTAPTVTSVTPNTSAFYDGRGTDQVAIVGTGFTTARAVWFGVTLVTAVQATFSVNSSTSITAWAPPGETGAQAYVFVETNYGTNANLDTNNDFMYPSSAVPTLTTVVPASGFPGDEIVLTGTNFSEATYVQWGTLYAGFRIDSATSIRATVPGDQSFIGGTVNVYVSNPWGISADTRTFTYGALAAKNLKTTPTLSTGAVAKTTNDSWIVTASAVTCTLSAAYSGMPANSVDSTWYRLDNGADVKYSGSFQVHAASTNGSHKIEYWSIGKDGYVEPTNVGYVNVVMSTTVTLTTTAAIGSIEYSWTRVMIPGVFYELLVDTNATPTTLVCTTQGNSFSYKLSAGATGVYARVRALAPDGTAFSYSSTSAQTVSLQNQSTDLADDAITLAKLAPGIQPPAIYTGGSLPVVFTDYPAGAILYWTNDSNLYKSTGSAWTKLIGANDIIADTITAGQIAVGAIGATELAANSVFAKHLVVADFENLIPNANSELTTTSHDLSWSSDEVDFRGVDATLYNRGTKSRRRLGNGTGSLDDQFLELCRPIPCKATDRFRFSSVSRCDVAQAGYGCRVQIVGLDAALAEVENSISTYNSTTAWTDQFIEHAISSASVVYVVARAVYNGTAATTYGYFDDMLFRKMMAGTLVVDGGITTGKLTVDGTMQAAIVTAGAINAVTIDAVTITGGVISGATFKTTTGTLRVEMTSSSGAAGYVKWFTGEAAEQQPGKLYVAGIGTNNTRMRLVAPTMNSLDTGALIDLLSKSSTAHDHAIQIKVDGSGAKTAPSILMDSLTDLTTIGGTVEIPDLRPTVRDTVVSKLEFFGPSVNYGANAFVGADFSTIDYGSGSTSVATVSETDHPGILQITCPAAATSGRYVRTGNVVVTLTPGDRAEFIARFPSIGLNMRARLGFSNAITAAAPTAGAWFETYWTGTYYVLRGASYNAGINYTATYPASGASISASTWYRLVIEQGASGHTYFSIYAAGSATPESGWDRRDDTGVQASGACGLSATSWTVSTVSQNNLDLDYMAMYLVPRSR